MVGYALTGVILSGSRYWQYYSIKQQCTILQRNWKKCAEKGKRNPWKRNRERKKKEPEPTASIFLELHSQLLDLVLYIRCL
jgi:hypothetical protein